MHVANGMVELQTEGMSAKLWMDMAVNALRVELTSAEPTKLTVELQRWRNQTRPWTDAEQGYSFYCDWHNRTTMPPDVIAPPTAGSEDVVWPFGGDECRYMEPCGAVHGGQKVVDFLFAVGK